MSSIVHLIKIIFEFALMIAGLAIVFSNIEQLDYADTGLFLFLCGAVLCLAEMTNKNKRKG